EQSRQRINPVRELPQSSSGATWRRHFPAAPAEIVTAMPAAMAEIVPRHLVFMRTIRIVPDDQRPRSRMSGGKEEAPAAAEVLRVRRAGAIEEEEVERLAIPRDWIFLHDPRSGRTHFVEAKVNARQPGGTGKRLLQARDPV